MVYKTLFESEPINTTTAMLGIAIILLIVISGFVFICWRFRTHRTKRSNFIIYSVVFLAVFFFGTYCLIQVPIQKANIYDQYVAGNVYTEEGNVQIIYVDEKSTNIQSIFLDAKNTNEYYFVVNDVEFSLDRMKAYCYNWADGDPCVEEDQYVKISYVKYRKKNLIMKIEVLTDTQE